MRYGKIMNTGKYLPDKILTNEDLEKMVDTSDEWIYSRTGIKERRIAIEDNHEMATKAAWDALSGTDIKPEDIDLIITATMSSEYAFPAVACLIQKAIGAENAMAFDLSAACSGFMFALTTANQYIKSGMAKTVLVVGVEKLSQLMSWEDRNTCVLFGDGAGAVILQASEEPGILAEECRSIGSKYECLTAEIQYIQTPFYDRKQQNYTIMEGREVFEFACTMVPDSILRILKDAGLTKEEVDLYILHQANIRIIDRIAKVLKLSRDRFFTNIDKYGNTSAASVAIALDEVYKSGVLTGKKAVLAGFGAGLTYGSSVIQF